MLNFISPYKLFITASEYKLIFLRWYYYVKVIALPSPPLKIYIDRDAKINMKTIGGTYRELRAYFSIENMDPRIRMIFGHVDSLLLRTYELDDLKALIKFYMDFDEPTNLVKSVKHSKVKT